MKRIIQFFIRSYYKLFFAKRIMKITFSENPFRFNDTATSFEGLTVRYLGEETYLILP